MEYLSDSFVVSFLQFKVDVYRGIARQDQRDRGYQSTHPTVPVLRAPG